MTRGELHGIYTLLFMLVFLGMVVWVFLPRRKKTYDDAAEMPFRETPDVPADQSRKD